MSNEIKQELITNKNITLATSIQNEIFPHYSAYTNYYESVTKQSTNQYFILYDEKTPIGVSGLYNVPIDKTSAWLGWFGIIEKYRRNHYGSIALRLYEEEAIRQGYLYARIYTDRDNNERAISFYLKNGYTREEYNNPQDTATIKYPIIIFSKSLSEKPLIPWNNRNIDLTDQIGKQESSTIITLTNDNINDLMSLYEECFLKDHYFLEYFKGGDLKDIMEHSFKKMFELIIKKFWAYGIYKGNEMIALLLTFDYFEMEKDYKNDLNNIFTSDFDNDKYPYENIIHKKIKDLKQDVIYLLAIAVKDTERNKGIAKNLITFLMNKYPNKTIISDVSNGKSLSLYQNNGFDISSIDEDYYLVIKDKIEL